MNLKNITADRLVSLYANRDLSVTEVITSVFDEIDRSDGNIHAFITLCRERALEEARRTDSRIAAEEPLSALTGVPVAIKDNMNLRDVPTTCGSKMLANYVPPYTATAVERLRSAGAIIIGKTNMDEFAMGSSTENSSFFVTRNPHDLERVPGGSSGGSAASVAAGMSLIALGSDTGGSIRQPASFCGVVGMKPTYGRVSRYGLVAYASSLDQIGPFTKSVRECAQVLETIVRLRSLRFDICGYSGRFICESPGSADEGHPNRNPARILSSDGMDPEVKANVESAIRRYETMGCKIEEIRLPHTEHAVATYYLIATAEASSNLARYDGVRYGLREGGTGGLAEMYRKTRMTGFGKEVKRRILLGTYALSAGYYDAYYLKALKVRTLILQDFQKAFEKVNIILTPTTPTACVPDRRKDGRSPVDVSLGYFYDHLQSVGTSGNFGSLREDLRQIFPLECS